MSPRPNSLAAKDAAFHFHGYTNALKNEKDGGFVVTRGKGVYIYDEDGKEYMDGLAGLWCCSLGFGEVPRITQAIVAQMQALPYYHTFTQKTAAVVVELAEKLVSLAPVPMSKAYFCNSGSEANDTVIKMVRYLNNGLGRPQKKKFISRVKAYHGVTVAAGSLTGLPAIHKDFDLPIAGILHTDCPHYYRFGQPGETEEQFATRCAESLEKMILAEGPDTVAAFIAEPVMGAGGVIVPPRTYWDKIQAVLKKYDVLLVADEVICGFGRTGNFWGSQTFGMKPDILTTAKQLSAGFMPIAAHHDEPARVRGAARQQQQEHQLRARHHLFRPSGLRGLRGRGAEDLRGEEDRRPRARADAAFPEAAALLRRSSAGRRMPRRRPGRRDRAGEGQEDQGGLRSVAAGRREPGAHGATTTA